MLGFELDAAGASRAATRGRPCQGTVYFEDPAILNI
jgi:hypothetical protein